ncbi:hypothetical protein CPB84DRAFT_1554595 [Gymnopilus junonius]|uniref:Uncharacterized protein n=1 Tax=Gymnopilus junonius TaxID=109634 RepID=A0A9P5TK44_GYMJU|nr:hypothetical protein CPB84DRAFT_1554595 [Gymnopilus junonius]
MDRTTLLDTFLRSFSFCEISSAHIILPLYRKVGRTQVFPGHQRLLMDSESLVLSSLSLRPSRKQTYQASIEQSLNEYEYLVIERPEYQDSEESRPEFVLAELLSLSDTNPQKRYFLARYTDRLWANLHRRTIKETWSNRQIRIIISAKAHC